MHFKTRGSKYTYKHKISPKITGKYDLVLDLYENIFSSFNKFLLPYKYSKRFSSYRTSKYSVFSFKITDTKCNEIKQCFLIPSDAWRLILPHISKLIDLQGIFLLVHLPPRLGFNFLSIFSRFLPLLQRSNLIKYHQNP